MGRDGPEAEATGRFGWVHGGLGMSYVCVILLLWSVKETDTQAVQEVDSKGE